MEEVSLSREILESITGRKGLIYQLILLLLAYLASLFLKMPLSLFSPIPVVHAILFATSLIARYAAKSEEMVKFFVGLLLILLLGMLLIYLAVFLPVIEVMD